MVIGCMCVQSVFKAHEGAVHAMQLCQISSGSATPGPLCLVTSGEQQRVSLNRGAWRIAVDCLQSPY